MTLPQCPCNCKDRNRSETHVGTSTTTVLGSSRIAESSISRGGERKLEPWTRRAQSSSPNGPAPQRLFPWALAHTPPSSTRSICVGCKSTIVPFSLSGSSPGILAYFPVPTPTSRTRLVFQLAHPPLPWLCVHTINHSTTVLVVQ